jgi:hypothetical protein
MRLFRAVFELLFPWLILASLSVVSWIYVLKPSARRRYEWLTWRCLRAKNKEQKELENALALAVFLITALTSTTILLFVLILARIIHER